MQAIRLETYLCTSDVGNLFRKTLLNRPCDNAPIVGKARPVLCWWVGTSIAQQSLHVEQVLETEIKRWCRKLTNWRRRRNWANSPKGLQFNGLPPYLPAPQDVTIGVKFCHREFGKASWSPSPAPIGKSSDKRRAIFSYGNGVHRFLPIGSLLNHRQTKTEALELSSQGADASYAR